MNSFHPLVTVLMPVYNADRYLGEAMESILAQTFRDFEFLIIDDGSTDTSAEIVQSYSDPRIRFIQNERNLGITATLNKGIQLASCELIARMDADDISYPNRLEKQYQYFQVHPNCALLSNAIRYISADKKKARNIYYDYDCIYYELIFTCKINHPVVMYRRSVLLKEGGYLTQYAEDFNLWWRISRKYEFFHDNAIMLDYRFTDSSLWKESKKSEYDQAEYEQIVRNINYYSDNQLTLTYDEVDFLRKNLKPLLIKNGSPSIKNSFRKLDQLNQYVLEKEKGGTRLESIKKAIIEKRKERVRNLKRYMKTRQVLSLLIDLRYWDVLVQELKSPVVKRIGLSS